MNLIPTRWYTVFFMPGALSITLMATGLFLMWRWSRRPAASRGSLRRPSLPAVAGLALLYVSSTPLMATWLARTLERQVPFLPAEEAPKADAIVVLGGGQQGHATDHGRSHLFMHHAGDRLETGLRAFHAGKAPLLVLGGGSIPLPDRPLVGDFLRRVAVERGVPDAAIVSCGPANYTTDEMAQLAEAMRARGVRSVLLCTSALHMPRARRIVEALGFRVTCLPCDFETLGAAERLHPLLLVPRGLALAQTENCLKEWLGLLSLKLGATGPDSSPRLRPAAPAP